MESYKDPGSDIQAFKETQKERFHKSNAFQTYKMHEEREREEDFNFGIAEEDYKSMN